MIEKKELLLYPLWMSIRKKGEIFTLKKKKRKKKKVKHGSV